MIQRALSIAVLVGALVVPVAAQPDRERPLTPRMPPPGAPAPGVPGPARPSPMDRIKAPKAYPSCGECAGGINCCGIVKIDLARKVVTAREQASGRTFEFKVNDEKLLHSLKPGQKVFAHYDKGHVSCDGETTCGTIIGQVKGAPRPAATK